VQVKKEPFAPSFQDDPDMLDFIASLSGGTWMMHITENFYPTGDEYLKRPNPNQPHHCVDFRGKMYVIWKKE